MLITNDNVKQVKGAQTADAGNHTTPDIRQSDLTPFPHLSTLRLLYTNSHVTLYQGDCLRVLGSLADSSVDAVLTDPPYCSGGAMMAQRSQPSRQKYFNTKQNRTPEFLSDCLDQRVWMRWTTAWLHQCYRVAKEGAFIACFIDWRQLPAMTDCFQLSNWRWMGVAPWDKVQARPQKGKLRGQCEYIVWGAKGKLAIQEGVYLPGLFTYTMVPSAKRYHMTEKPVSLLKHLLEATPPACTVLDPFFGSGSTAIACTETGRSCIGIELSKTIAEIAKDRTQMHGKQS